jgi:hypothetical protein
VTGSMASAVTPAAENIVERVINGIPCPSSTSSALSRWCTDGGYTICDLAFVSGQRWQERRTALKRAP